MKSFLVFFLCFLIISCQSLRIQAPLSWENSEHPERGAWSEAVRATVDEQFLNLDKAQNVGDFCPQYPSLQDSKKKMFWSELVVKMAFYESKWNPET
ncbi:MAG: hypothetical protein AB7H97_22520, partial [Pseudobdellovibrionaceae bacterium]